MAKKPKLPKTATLRGRRWNIVMVGPCDGLCDHPQKKDRDIIIMAEPYSCDELVTIIHEALHAEKWVTDEDTVGRISTEIGKLLWRFGYRRK